MNYISLTTKIIISIFCILLIFFVVVTYLPYNPLTPSPKARLYLMAILPEGWGFFTKNPQDEQIFIFERQKGEWLSILKTPNSSMNNLFGIKRDARSQGSEYGILLNELAHIDSVRWEYYENKSLSTCLQSTNLSAFQLDNNVKNPTICGEIIILRQKPIPWAWAKHSVEMPIHAIRLTIRCNGKND